MKSIKNKALLIEAVIGAILITLLLIPFQSLTQYAPYTWILLVPLVMFFSLGGNCKILPAMFLSFLCGALWGLVFFYFAGLMSSYPIAMVFGILTTVIIFAILAIHPIFLGKTPFGIVPCVLLGFIESLFTFLIKPSNVSPIGPIHLVVFFGYGMVLSFILAKANELFCKLILGEDSSKSITK